MNRIVDASVVVKWLVPEAGSDRATELMRQPVAAPDGVIAAVLNALRKKVIRRELRPDDARDAADLLAQSGITFEPTQALAPAILSMSLQLSLSTCDCAYLAIARKLDGVLITANERLLSRCRSAPSVAPLVRSLFDDNPPMVQERPPRAYMARRKAA